jgi:hypothetical protein
MSGYPQEQYWAENQGGEYNTYDLNSGFGEQSQNFGKFFFPQIIGELCHPTT